MTMKKVNHLRKTARERVVSPNLPPELGNKRKRGTQQRLAASPSVLTEVQYRTDRETGRQRVVSPSLISKEEESLHQSLRPPTLAEYIGQKEVVEKLEIALQAAKQRGEPLEHALFHGPPGLGKTTLAYIIAYAMASKIITTSGPALERTHQLMG